MSFIGKLVAPEGERKRQRPLQLLPVNNNALLQRFEKTLVGRILNLEAQENRVKSLLAFLPTVWKCEGRVQGMEMGRGRFHFRFKEEEDIHRVLANRPYHFEGWMLAIERWVPTVRLDFPTSIPFWICIMDLPDIYNEEKQVKRIGEDLGEVLNWNLEEPIPMIQVMVECEAPIVLFRDTVSEEGEIFRLRFDYLKLQGHCKYCYRLTHDTRSCPGRVDVGANRRDRLREHSRNHGAGRDRRGRGTHLGGSDLSWRISEKHADPWVKEEVRASSPKRRPVRRNLSEELGASDRVGQEREVVKGTTKDWVQRTFATNRGTEPEPAPEQMEPMNPRANGQNREKTNWYRRTEEEAAAMNLLYAQNAAWEKAEGTHRQSEKVEPEAGPGTKGRPINRNSDRGRLPETIRSEGKTESLETLEKINGGVAAEDSTIGPPQTGDLDRSLKEVGTESPMTRTFVQMETQTP